MNQRHKRKLRKMMFISIAWMIIGLILEGYTYFILSEFNAVTSEYNFTNNIIIISVAVFLSGLLGGYVITYLLEDWLRSKPFWKVLRNIFVVFTLVFFISSFTGTFLQAYLKLDSPTISSAFKQTGREFFGLTYLRMYIFWLAVTLGTMIFLQVSDKYGPGGFRSLLMGRYFRPQPDHRIFLFLDLRSSTTIAEKLGEEKYFRLIRKCYHDMTNCILDHRGEIYQYVGDEIVVSWPSERGLQNANCLRCYFAIQEKLQEHAEEYHARFGVAPVFKAGLHLGPVTAGEIGVIKKDITYSGDVLNTTARIQGMCNDLSLEILLSDELKDNLEKENAFVFESKGEIQPRGKTKQLEIFTVKKV